MRFCLFITYAARDPAPAPAPVSRAALAELKLRLAGVDGMSAALAHTPADARDPFLAGQARPALVVQLLFGELMQLEAAAGRRGPLQALVETGAQLGLPPHQASQQVMLARPFAVPQPATPVTPPDPMCSYLVGYEGEAAGLGEWLDHYLISHTRPMARLPGLRALEVFTRVDAVSHLPLRSERHMLRNRVVFDGPAALEAALASPVRAEMRADYAAFPPFGGAVSHHPFETHDLLA